MAKRLTKQAIEAIKGDPQLFADVCQALQVEVGGGITAINRNNRRLTELPVVALVAKKLGIDAGQVIDGESSLSTSAA